MTPLNITEILGKINELRAVFVLGQRAVPFLEEVFFFLKEITPLMDEINASVTESTRSMPRASSQLQSVTQQSELATTEALDLIDTVLERVVNTRTYVDQSMVHLEAMSRSDTRMMRMLRAELSGKNDILLSQLEIIHEEKKALRKNYAAGAKAQIQALNEIRDRMNRIMMSLQVQDITSQQIAAVNHMLESVRERMSHLIERLARGNLEQILMEPVVMESNGTFDVNARYDHSPARQSLANEVITSFHNGEAESGPACQDDIDALFGDGGFSSPPAAPKTTDPAPESAAPSQDDIDQLFSSGGTGASQDDIDKLFG